MLLCYQWGNTILCCVLLWYILFREYMYSAYSVLYTIPPSPKLIKKLPAYLQIRPPKYTQQHSSGKTGDGSRTGKRPHSVPPGTYFSINLFFKKATRMSAHYTRDTRHARTKLLAEQPRTGDYQPCHDIQVAKLTRKSFRQIIVLFI